MISYARDANKEAIREWVAALRSGDFKQGRAFLVLPAGFGGSEERTYCCLGVACEVFKERLNIHTVADLSEDTDPTFHVPEQDRIISYYWSEDDPDVREETVTQAILPTVVAKYLGINRSPIVRTHVDEELVGLNDDREWTFKMIADAIEATYLKEETNA